MAKIIQCPSGISTRILFSFGVGMVKDWVVTFASSEGKEIAGETLEQKAAWIIPRRPIASPIARRMVFQRNWINAIYWVKVKPTSTITATIE